MASNSKKTGGGRGTPRKDLPRDARGARDGGKKLAPESPPAHSPAVGIPAPAESRPAMDQSPLESPPAQVRVAPSEERADQPDLPPRLPDEPPAPGSEASQPGSNGAVPAEVAPAPLPPPTMHAKAQVDFAPSALLTQAAPPAVKPDVRAQGPSQPPLLFEVAWEVCWQLGGIYTVLKTKAKTMIGWWEDRYCLVGPYNPATADVEFEEQTPDPLIRETLDRLRQIGVVARYGRWLVEGRPRTILLDHRSRYNRLGDDKYLLWNDHRISTPTDDGEVNDVVAFGFCAAEFFRVLTELAQGRPILAHFHEWMGGIAVPRIAHMRLPVATVFTTHATLLGRYLASDNPYFYQHLPFIDPDKEAAKFNIYSRYAIEKAAAHASTVFSTVSEVTAVEAEKLLGRKPEAILPNGLNIQRFTAVHEFQNLHRQYKERIHDFVMGHFFPAYEFDLDNTLYFFTSGRYEYRNKGFDMFIEALARLNWRLKSERQHLPDPEHRATTVVGFVITRAPTRNINVNVLQTQTMFDELKATIQRIQEGIGPALLHSSVRGRFPGLHEMFGEEARIRWKRAVAAWKHKRQPPIVTHDLVDDAGDRVMTHLRHKGLFNSADDPVKIIFHPEFVSATSPILHLDYDQFVRGCHLGVFPSYYEPWGYTPMEAIALGVPALTSDLSGFGAYVQRHVPEHRNKGIYVVPRHNRSFDDACNEIVEYLHHFTRMSRRDRINLRNQVERLGELFDWESLARHYDEAHQMALSRVGAKAGKVEVRLI
jgi:glycogen(starch) synthase